MAVCSEGRWVVDQPEAENLLMLQRLRYRLIRKNSLAPRHSAKIAPDFECPAQAC